MGGRVLGMDMDKRENVSEDEAENEDGNGELSHIEIGTGNGKGPNQGPSRGKESGNDLNEVTTCFKHRYTPLERPEQVLDELGNLEDNDGSDKPEGNGGGHGEPCREEAKENVPNGGDGIEERSVYGHTHDPPKNLTTR